MSLNQYTYANANPIRGFDPTGHFCQDSLDGTTVCDNQPLATPDLSWLNDPALQAFFAGLAANPPPPPEIDFGKIEKVMGLNIAIVTTAKTDREAKSLLGMLGMPFRK